MSKARKWLKGKKAYVMAAIGLAGAVVAWSDGQIDTLALLASVWAAVQAICIRAGLDNAVAKTVRTETTDHGGNVDTN